LKPEEFERIIAELLRSMGHDVQLTPPSKDGGRDILVYMTVPPSLRLLTIVECKKWKRERRIEIGDVREFLYVIRDYDKASRGMFVTTAYFTLGARQLEEQWNWQMSLHDFDVLREWIEQYGKWKPTNNGGLWVPTGGGPTKRCS
jgi:restriction system protein